MHQTALYLMFSLELAALGQDPIFRWVKGVGGVDDDYGWAIAVDRFNQSYVTGYFFGESSFGGHRLASSGSADVFLLKLDRSGDVLWATTSGGTSRDEGHGVAVDLNGNIYVAGDFTGTARFGPVALSSRGRADIFIAKFDSAGNGLWSGQAGGTSPDHAYAIAVDASGNSYLTGSYEATASFGPTNLTSDFSFRCFVAKYNPQGELVWVRNSGADEVAVGQAIAVDENGNSWVAGNRYPRAMAATNTLTTDIFVVHYDRAGNSQWTRAAGGPERDVAQSVAVDSSGNCYVTGHFDGIAAFGGIRLSSRGHWDVFVLKYDPSGNVLWVRQEGGSNTDDGRGIAVDSSGNCYVTGYFLGEATFGSRVFHSGGQADGFFAKYDPAGQLVWAVQTAGTAYISPNGIAVDPAAMVHATGYFRNSTTFGGLFLPNSSSGRDVFVAKIENPPPIPRLSIARVDQALWISWPTQLEDFGLETSTEPAPRTAWSAATDSPVVIGGQNVITNAPPDPQRFYRLRKQ